MPEDEEAYLTVAWVPLEEAVGRFLAGDLHNGVAGVGILSAYAARQDGFAALAPGGRSGDPVAIAACARRGIARQRRRAAPVTREDPRS